tara:strand:+ start:48 stop:413 length:366 start_codon:yes stop_codon:yes gene_type:complete
MIKINEITTGAVVTMETTFTVKKVNKKSVVIEDTHGKSHVVRGKDLAKYGIVSTTMVPTKSATKTVTRKSLPSLRGRYPKWATSTAKQEFVRAERAEGNKATQETYAEYKNYLRVQKHAAK